MSLCIYGLIAFILTISHPVERRLESLTRILDLTVLPMPVNSLSWICALLVLGFGLWRAKRWAWTLSVVGLLLLNVTNIVIYVFAAAPYRYADFYVPYFYVGCVTQLVFFWVLVARRQEFSVLTRHGDVGRALVTWIVGNAIVFAVGLALIHRWPGTLEVGERVLWVLNHTFAFSMVDRELFTGRAPWVVSLPLSALSAVVLLIAIVILGRSQQGENTMSSADEDAVRALLSVFGSRDSLGYFATRRDKSVVFAPTGAAAVTYRVEQGVALASGDPIGDPHHWSAAIQAWMSTVAQYGWTPAVMGASEHGATEYARSGLRAMKLGDEAIVRCDGFRLSGAEMKPVRQACNHAKRNGVSVRVRRHSQISAEELQGIQNMIDAWRGTPEERGFSMALSRIGDPRDGQCVLAEAVIEGETVALLSFVPWGARGLSLDVMRRGPHAPNGTIEAIIVALCTDDAYGISQLSLNFAVFREIFAREGQVGVGAWESTLRKSLSFLSKWWQIETLYRSNQKYQPLWKSRYLCFPSSFSLAHVAIASGLAEGFLPSWGPDLQNNSAISQPEAPLAVEYVRNYSPGGRAKGNEQTRVRLNKAHLLQQRGIDPWPVAVPTTVGCGSISSAHKGNRVRVHGRIEARREFGGVSFLQLRDATGSGQVIVENTEGPINLLDLGDLVVVDGDIGASRSGTPSVLARRIDVEAKALHPPVHCRDTVSPTVARLKARHTVTQAFRKVLIEQGFLEVETPILQRVHGGANARPFATHLNSYNLDLTLRIAPELFLKRLMVQGAERIFEIGRVFRNEGVDATHNPEFTSMEAYAAHGDYRTMMVLAQQLIQAAATAVHGKPVVPDPTGNLVSIAGNWPVKTVYEAVSEGVSEALERQIHIGSDSDREVLRQLCTELGISTKANWNEGEIVEELYERFVEVKTTVPTFYCDFPSSVSPLARGHRSSPGVAERWDLVAWGVELGTAYSELTNPIEQRRRLEEQSFLAADGDPEAMEVDEEFLRALEVGMPPTGGLGIGMDRVIMLITGRTIRDVLAFPLADRHSSSSF